MFIALTLALLAFTYFLVFRIDLGGSELVTVRFDSVGTIQTGSPVRQSGVKVGSVSRIGLAADERGRVDVELALYKGLTVRTQDRVSIVTGGLLGDQFIDIVPGPAEAPVADPRVPLRGNSGLDLKLLVDGGGDLIQDLSVSSRAIATFLANHSDELDTMVADAARGIRHAADAAERADRLLQKAEGAWDPAAADVQQTLAALREASSSLKHVVDGLGGPGTLVELLKSPATSGSTAETLDNLRSASRSLKEVTAALEATLQ